MDSVLEDESKIHSLKNIHSELIRTTDELEIFSRSLAKGTKWLREDYLKNLKGIENMSSSNSALLNQIKTKIENLEMR